MTEKDALYERVLEVAKKTYDNDMLVHLSGIACKDWLPLDVDTIR